MKLAAFGTYMDKEEGYIIPHSHDSYHYEVIPAQLFRTMLGIVLNHRSHAPTVRKLAICCYVLGTKMADPRII